MFTTVIIGCGAIAHTHAEVLCKLENIQVVAICDILPERASALKEKFGFHAEIFTDYKQMLEQIKPQTVHICTPHYLHFEMAAFALEKGIHTVLEKPVCISNEQLKALTAIAEKSSAKIGVCFQNRYLERNRAAKELIASGKTGAIKGARAFVTWSRGDAYYTESGWRGTWEKEGGGVMINQAIHTLDLMLWLCGNAKTVTATVGNRHLKGVIEVEDTAEAYIEFESGVKGLFYATTAYCTDAPIFLEVVCEKSTLTFFNDNLLIDGVPFNGGSTQAAIASSKSYWGQGHVYIIEEFYGLLDTPDKVPVDVAEAGKALKVLLAMYQSDGQPVRL